MPFFHVVTPSFWLLPWWRDSLLSQLYILVYFLMPLSLPCHTSAGSGRTLRETVLESSPVLALLNQSFISSWSLVRELENMQVTMATPSENQPVIYRLRGKSFTHRFYWTWCFFPATGWWAELSVEREGQITPGEVQLPCGDDGGAAQWNNCKYFSLLPL